MNEIDIHSCDMHGKKKWWDYFFFSFSDREDPGQSAVPGGQDRSQQSLLAHGARGQREEDLRRGREDPALERNLQREYTPTLQKCGTTQRK